MSESLILGLASILSSGVVGSVGLYLVYHARSQPFRERLYEAQLALLSDIAERVIALNSICLVHRVQSDELARLKTLLRAAEVGKELGSLCSRAPVLLPASICVAITEYGKALVPYFRTKGSDDAALAALHEACHALVDPIRAFTGVDPMSEETLRMFRSFSDPGD